MTPISGQGFQRFRNGIFRADIIPAVTNDTVFVHKKGGTNNPHVVFAVQLLLTPHAKLIRHLAVGIGKERKVQAVVFGKLFLLFRLVRADPHRVGVEAVQLWQRIPYAGGLSRSPGSVGFGVEKNQQFTSFVLFQGHGVAVLIGQIEGWRFVAGLKGGHCVLLSSNLLNIKN